MDILVHVSAPATVQHDKQHLALAQAIIDFHPAFITRADTYDDTETLLESASELNPKPKASAYQASPDATTRRPLKRARTVSTINPNPPYRNPFRGRRSITHQESGDTALLPGTADGSSPDLVQVPRTHSVVRRAFSDPLPSTSSKITDSQEPLSHKASSDGRISSPLGLKGDIVRNLSQASIEDQPPLKRARLAKNSSLSPFTNDSEALSGDKARQLGLWSSPYVAGTPGTALASDVSTASPSQPMQIETIWPEGVNRTPAKSPSVVSISSGGTRHQSLESMASEQDQSPSAEGDLGQSSRDERSMLYPAIDALPIQVVAPEPPVGDGRFNTHVTEHLQELIDRPKLFQMFRPLQVARDVKVLERGYWAMDIVIAHDEIVNRARNSPTRKATVQSLSDRFGGGTAEERLNRFWQAKALGTLTEYDYGHEDQAVGKWTQAEFLTFWDQMSTFVLRGRAGWGVRMVRDDLGEELIDGSTVARKLRIRIFTWGEVIAHIYLAIWLCSDKLAIRIPMKWIAGNGTTVVNMSGKKQLTGNLAPWTRKGPAGEGGSWGISSVV